MRQCFIRLHSAACTARSETAERHACKQDGHRGAEQVFLTAMLKCNPIAFSTQRHPSYTLSGCRLAQGP